MNYCEAALKQRELWKELYKYNKIEIDLSSNTPCLYAVYAL